MAKKPLKFAHLHQHTSYSLLDGAARIKDLMQWVKDVTPDDPTIAMTDHGNMHGAVDFYRTAEAEGVKPIIGFEAYVAAGSRWEKKRASNKLDGGYFHLTLLAKNFEGYQNLCKLNSRGWTEGFYGKPRVDHELLSEYSEGVIALSGCLGAQIPRSLLDGSFERGEQMLQEYLKIYGDDFFIELQNHVPPDYDRNDPKMVDLAEQQLRLNPMLKELALSYGLGMVATNDGHYVRKEDARAHEALLAIQTKTTLSNPDRFRFACDEFYVKTPEEMALAIPESEFEGAISNTMVVADMCDITLPIGSKRVYQMPELPIPEGRTLAEQLRLQSYQGVMARYPEVTAQLFYDYLALAQLYVGGTVQPPQDLETALLQLARIGETCRIPKEEGANFDSYIYPYLEKLKEKYGEDSAIVKLERVEFELGVIIAMGFPDYFLIVADFINWAKAQKIPVGPGRGSGAGSIVAYALNITNIEPLQFNLLFERFLNPDRVSMPDFDIDFADNRRSEVIDYVRDKYGEEKVAFIATFGTMASKAAVKDAARVMEAPYSDADAFAKLIPVVFGKPTPIAKAMEEIGELRQMYDANAKEFVDVAMSLEGLTRHASVHAAGVIIAREPIQELAPVFKSGDALVCQYDMGSVEDLGFIKMDFLGLRTLTFIDTVVRIVKESRGETLVPDDFPPNDTETMALLSRGDAAGVFQFESAGMVDTLKKLKPRRIQDLIAVSALYRPGPMENIPTYIRRHHGQEEVLYNEFPSAEQYLAPILEETYGIPVYQEQIMQIAQAVAGYSLGEADLLRRAMGKKKVEEMEKQRIIFEQGAKERGIPSKESNGIFDLLEKFANYGFNKCLTGDTLICNARTGELRSLEALYNSYQQEKTLPNVVSQYDFHLQHAASLHIQENGIKPIYQLSTMSGKNIKATGNHPFLTLSGWRALEELEQGAWIAAPAYMPVYGQHDASDKVLRNLAAMTLFPARIFSLGRESISKLLAYYIEQVGVLNKAGLWLRTPSLEQAHQVQHLCLRLGIIAQLDIEDSHHLYITSYESLQHVQEYLLKHMTDFDAASLATWLEQYPRESYANDGSEDILPPEAQHFIEEALEQHAISESTLEAAGLALEILDDGCVPKRYVRKLADYLDDENLYRISSPDLLWEQIMSLTPAGEAMTYDLEIDTTHNFVANDLIVHNSHSAAYGALSYQTAYLKAHYPVEFAAGLLTVERANSDKVAQYVIDTRHMGIDVLRPDINQSRSDFTPVAGVVRFGLYGIKNVGDAAVEHILEVRQREGAFKDLYDFCQRVDGSVVNKRALEHLIKAGAFDELGDRSSLLANMEAALKWGIDQRNQQAAGQSALFGIEEVRPPKLEPAQALSQLELLQLEKVALGLYVSDHPLNSYAGLAEAASCPVDSLEDFYRLEVGLEKDEGYEGAERRKLVLAGLMQNVVKKSTKSGNMMARFNIADMSGSREIVAFSRTYERIAHLLADDVPVILVVDVSPDSDGGIRVVADRLIRWDHEQDLPEVAIFEFNLQSVSEQMILDLRSYIDEVCDNPMTPLQLRVRNGAGIYHIETDGLRVDKHKLPEIEGYCPWLKSTVTFNRESLLQLGRQEYWQQEATPASGETLPF